MAFQNNPYIIPQNNGNTQFIVTNFNNGKIMMILRNIIYMWDNVYCFQQPLKIYNTPSYATNFLQVKTCMTYTYYVEREKL